MEGSLNRGMRMRMCLRMRVHRTPPLHRSNGGGTGTIRASVSAGMSYTGGVSVLISAEKSKRIEIRIGRRGERGRSSTRGRMRHTDFLLLWGCSYCTMHCTPVSLCIRMCTVPLCCTSSLPQHISIATSSSGRGARGRNPILFLPSAHN